MKKITLFLLSCCSAIAVSAQTKTHNDHQPDTSKKMQIVEASCGQCKFGMAGKGCSLAVRINGKAYFVDGSKIDDHGDAHASDGFCEAIRKAEVKGEVVNNRFQATYFKLVKADNTNRGVGFCDARNC
jgi:hypothetical protein